MTARPYTLWSPFYDWIAGPFFKRFREQAVRELELRSGERLFIAGVGTGLDFPLLPRAVEITGVDLNASMLARARRRAGRLGLEPRLELADAEALPFADESFDRAYLPLIVCVAEDGGRVLREALRVIRPGARLVVLDKFLAEGASPGLLRRATDRVLGPLVTRINRRWSEVSSGASGFTVLADRPGPLGGFFRLIVLRKDTIG